MTRPQTLSARLFLLTALWAVIATALVAWILSESFRANALDNLSQRLLANLYNIMGTVTVGDDGRISGAPDLRDARFLTYGSGAYWSVTNVNDPEERLASSSLGQQQIEVPETRPFDADFQRSFTAVDAFGNAVLGIEAQAFLGDGDALYSFRITGNLTEVDSQVSQFVNRLLLVLALFALGFVLVTWFLLRIGLRPLSEATRKLADIREGRAERLEGEFPLEIQPLIDETNSLITSNRNVIERARTQVGNLAHSLKTPLAVLRNEADRARPEVKRVVEDQVSQMQAQIQTYLDRARISARAGTVTSRCDVRPVIARLARVMSKLNPQLSITSDIPGDDPCWFAGEQQDFEEMVGNLLENACKFAKSSVVISARIDMPNLRVSIADDGRGMTGEEAEMAMKRGMRIDETKPGSGLGLSIVKDIAAEYSGELVLGRSKHGGLSADLVLPTVKSGVR